jgi:integrase
MAGLSLYLVYYDIDVVPSKFKRKVRMPKAYREDEEALDVRDIRNVLLVCNNRRLKTYILVLASGGFRAVEALAIRHKDIDFSASPTKIHVRKEYSKTRVSRDVCISDEATKFLKDWISWKYKDKGEEWIRNTKSLEYQRHFPIDQIRTVSLNNTDGKTFPIKYNTELNTQNIRC